MDLRVVAEGVEAKDQLSFLDEKGCDELQGYLFSRPLDKLAFADLLSKAEDLGASLVERHPPKTEGD